MTITVPDRLAGPAPGRIGGAAAGQIGQTRAIGGQLLAERGDQPPRCQGP